MIQIELPADPAYLVVLCAAVKTFATTQGLSNEESRRLEVAVDEVATNVIIHAYKESKDAHYRVELSRESNDIIIKIFDRGDGFELEKVPEPNVMVPIEDLALGGLGLFLARKMTDQIHYQKNDNGENCLTLRKHLTLQQAAEA